MDKPHMTLDELFNELDGREMDLTGCYEGVLPRTTWGETPNTFTVTIDGEDIMFVEDPEDGYRSCLNYVQVSKSTVAEQFHCTVWVRWSQRHDARVLEFFDIRTGKNVVEVGTENTDDYYPYFVGRFDPTAMYANQPEQHLKTCPHCGNVI